MQILKPYPSYKDSGVEWLGKVPEGWEILPLCAIAKPQQVTNQQHRELLSVYLGRGVVPFSSVDEKRTNPTSEDLSKYQAVEPGDFVLNNQQAWRGSVGVSRYQGIVSPAYLVLALDGRLERDFANSLLAGREMVAQYLVSSKGVGTIQRNLYWPYLRRVALQIPPSAEQIAIVRFLGYMDRRIQRLIRAKQRLIKLLEEQKQAIIHEAVTGRIDVRTGKPYPSYKDSGVEWLVEVPEGWELRRLGSSVRGCISGVWGAEPDGVNDLPCVRVADFDRFRLRVRLEKPTLRAISKSERNNRLLREGDLLLEKSGGGDMQPVGVVILYDFDERAVCSNFIARMPVDEGYNSTFLVYLHSCLYSIRLNIRSIKQTTGIQNLDSSSYLSELVAFPPLPEQTAIVQYLDSRLASLSSSMESSSRAINLLKEYRTRLVSDVVTGKVDVREAAALLPDENEAGGAEALSDEFEEQEPLDEEGFEPEGGDEE